MKPYGACMCIARMRGFRPGSRHYAVLGPLPKPKTGGHWTLHSRITCMVVNSMPLPKLRKRRQPNAAEAVFKDVNGR